MEKAHDVYKDFTRSDELTEAYEAHQKFQRDKAAEIDYARNEGREEARFEDAVAMEAEGISYEVIYKITGISEEQLMARKK
ncbi:MAG: hypothetical protein PQJ58_02490 [Spirochaetales bacterium]|nr:hypothetical protein [Spirochaetales bacterium]